MNAYHADAALVVYGRLVAAAEEERFDRVHHAAGSPHDAAGWCLADAGLTIAHVDDLAVAHDRARTSAKSWFATSGTGERPLP